jgi:hypothetical protein
MQFMSVRNKTFTRQPAKTKAELREMLAEAARNTQALEPEPLDPQAAEGQDRENLR